MSESSPPSNILFIVADDLNAWIGALGRHPQVRTPNIDALARRGDLFVNAYCSAPYCNASRMGFFTGQYPCTLGVYVNEPYWSQEKRPPTFIELLRDAGYYTFGAGKVFHGMFDYAVAGQTGASTAEWREVENRLELWDGYQTNVLDPLPADRPLNRLFDFGDFANVPAPYHLFDWGPLPDDQATRLPDELVADAVADFLAAPRREPFFCAAGFYKPHLPWHAPQGFFDIYTGDIALPVVKEDDLDDVPPLARQWATTPADHELVTRRGVWDDAVRSYVACISYVDHQIGRVLAAIDASPARDRTTVVLCGDNGFHLGEKLHWRKFALWEEATRVPLIVAQPAGGHKNITQPVSLIDIFPTMLELAGQAKRPSDGVSLLGIADGSAARPPVLMTWGDGNHSLRDRDWRYTLYTDGGEELYDHATDPHEWTNLALQPEFRGTCGDLRRMIEELCR